MKYIYINMLFLLVFIFACQEKSKPVLVEEQISIKDPSFIYDFSKPEINFPLEKSLREISGLSMSFDSKSLLAINDEQGKIFYLNQKDFKIEQSVNFNNRGDYEGIEAVGNDIFILKSNGHIYRYNLESQESHSIKTNIQKSLDLEGLAYLESKNKLLIACKSRSNSKHQRTIYSCNLDGSALNEFIVIDRKSIWDFYKIRNNSKNSKMRIEDFSPSAIAVHPHTNNIYVLSSRGKSLVVLDVMGKIHHVELLSNQHRQPEGICFDQKGTLFIANEAKSSQAKIFKYTM